MRKTTIMLLTGLALLASSCMSITRQDIIGSKQTPQKTFRQYGPDRGSKYFNHFQELEGYRSLQPFVLLEYRF